MRELTFMLRNRRYMTPGVQKFYEKELRGDARFRKAEESDFGRVRRRQEAENKLPVNGLV
jgi:anionic cell wall polymer biosynthesis LytR-Cps2A-Psr (LCP) family protein